MQDECCVLYRQEYVSQTREVRDQVVSRAVVNVAAWPPRQSQQ